MVLGGYSLYQFGRYRGGYDEVVVQQQFDEFKEIVENLKREINYLRERNKLLTDQIAILDRFSRIDRDAHDEVKAALNNAQRQSLELREELAFYRSLVLPSEMEPGLRIQSLTTEADVDPNSFNYTLVLTQVPRKKDDAVGVVSIRFNGLLDGEAIVYELSDVDKTVTGKLDFKFRYFQSFSGTMQFPQNFMPKLVSISARSEGEKLKDTRKTFKWETTLNRN